MRIFSAVSLSLSLLVIITCRLLISLAVLRKDRLDYKKIKQNKTKTSKQDASVSYLRDTVWLCVCVCVDKSSLLYRSLKGYLLWPTTVTLFWFKSYLP